MDKPLVLVVDDASPVRHTVSLALTHAGYEVETAVDGVNGLEKLDGRKFHLIVSDLHMPNMDGFEFIENLRQMPRYKFTPVVMLTTEQDDELRAKGKELGVRAWMVKPFKPKEMVPVMQKIIV